MGFARLLAMEGEAVGRIVSTDADVAAIDGQHPFEVGRDDVAVACFAGRDREAGIGDILQLEAVARGVVGVVDPFQAGNTLFHQRRRIQAGLQQVGVAIVAVGRVDKRAAEGDIHAPELEIYVVAVFECLVQFVFDQAENRPQGFGA